MDDGPAPPPPQARAVALTPEGANLVDARVASGAYASAEAVVQAGLEALEDHEADVERWLRDEVVPVYDAVTADPSQLIPAEEVFAELRALHEQRLRDEGE